MVIQCLSRIATHPFHGMSYSLSLSQPSVCLSVCLSVFAYSLYELGTHGFISRNLSFELIPSLTHVEIKYIYLQTYLCNL